MITKEFSCRDVGNNRLPTPSASNEILGIRLSERSNSLHHKLNNGTSFINLMKMESTNLKVERRR